MPAAVTTRRFPPPWTVKESGESFQVCDAQGQVLGYFYYEDEPNRRDNLRRLTRDEARRIATNFAKLPMVPRHVLQGIARPPHKIDED
jgi:hypothetical protein